jgi:hypothetical protein
VEDWAPKGQCKHPPLDGVDPWQEPTQGSQAATRHIPFLYFHSVIDDAAACRDVRDLADLASDLGTNASTPSLSFIVPDLCSDAHTAPCPDGRPGGQQSLEQFLRAWVPRVRAAPAYQGNGMLFLLVDEARSEGDGVTGDMAGGRTGALVLTPCLHNATKDDGVHTHYDLLATLEDRFGVPRLAKARTAHAIALPSC